MSGSSSGSGRKGGNPPVHTRFQKGQSGNRNGRPRGSKNIKTRIERVLNKLITITENGRQVKRALGDVLFQRLGHDGVKGDKGSAALLLRIAHAYGVGADEIGPAAAQARPADDGTLPDRDALRRIGRRIDDLLKDNEGE
jgi:hypothetical protein